MPEDSDQQLICSFCDTEEGEVAGLIAGPPGLFICSDCLQQVGTLVEGGGSSTFDTQVATACSFCSKVQPLLVSRKAATICMECYMVAKRILAVNGVYP